MNCSVLFVIFHAVSLLILKGGHGIFHMRSDHRVCSAHRGNMGSDKSAHMLTRKNWNTVFTPVSSKSQALATGFTVMCLADQPQTTCQFLRLRVLRLWVKQDSIDDDG